jgi:hypothetical protein
MSVLQVNTNLKTLRQAWFVLFVLQAKRLFRHQQIAKLVPQANTKIKTLL